LTVGADRAVTKVGGDAGPQGRFAYFYLMKADPDGVRLVAPRHASYWRHLGLAHYTGGPFADRTGGLITFDAADVAEAERAVRGDPFILEGLVGAKWLKRWTTESAGPTS
jgi:YCII-related domain